MINQQLQIKAGYHLATMTATTATEMQRELLRKIETKSAVVGVVGLGYVGLPLALLFAETEHPVVGFDIDQKKIDTLTRGASYIKHIGVERVANVFLERGAKATADFSRLTECDAIIVAVPTPLGEHREPDLTYIRATAEVIAKHLRRGQLVVLESTTYPGTTREELLGLQMGRASGAELNESRWIEPRSGERTVAHGASRGYGGGRVDSSRRVPEGPLRRVAGSSVAPPAPRSMSPRRATHG